VGGIDEAYSDTGEAAVGDGFVGFGGIVLTNLHSFDEAFEGLGDVKRCMEEVSLAVISSSVIFLNGLEMMQ
jgi:hypothetical protein